MAVRSRSSWQQRAGPVLAAGFVSAVLLLVFFSNILSPSTIMREEQTLDGPLEEGDELPVKILSASKSKSSGARSESAALGEAPPSDSSLEPSNSSDLANTMQTFESSTGAPRNTSEGGGSTVLDGPDDRPAPELSDSTLAANRDSELSPERGPLVPTALNVSELDLESTKPQSHEGELSSTDGAEEAGGPEQAEDTVAAETGAGGEEKQGREELTESQTGPEKETAEWEEGELAQPEGNSGTEVDADGGESEGNDDEPGDRTPREEGEAAAQPEGKSGSKVNEDGGDSEGNGNGPEDGTAREEEGGAAAQPEGERHTEMNKDMGDSEVNGNESDERTASAKQGEPAAQPEIKTENEAKGGSAQNAEHGGRLEDGIDPGQTVDSAGENAAKTEPNPQSQFASETDANPGPEEEPEPDSKLEAQAEDEARGLSGTDTKPEPEIQAETSDEDQAEEESQPETENRSEPENGTEAEVKIEGGMETDRSSDTRTESISSKGEAVGEGEKAAEPAVRLQNAGSPASPSSDSTPLSSPAGNASPATPDETPGRSPGAEDQPASVSKTPEGPGGKRENDKVQSEASDSAAPTEDSEQRREERDESGASKLEIVEEMQDESGDAKDQSGASVSETPEEKVDLSGIPDWAIEHFLDDPKEAASRPMLNPSCDLYKGRWVYDTTYPVWPDYMHPRFNLSGNCAQVGRKDLDYMKLRWQPHECNLPRFDAADFRKRMWGRRVVYVGDSLSRNMFYSMFGMLAHGADYSKITEGLPPAMMKRRRKTRFAYFFEEHNFTLEYYRSPILVEQAKAPEGAPQQVQKVLRLEVPSPMWADPVTGADIIVFNAGHWFNHFHLSSRGTYPSMKGVIDLEPDWDKAFKEAIWTWAKWANRQHSSGSQIFFRSMAPAHLDRKSSRSCPSDRPAWDPTPIPVDPYVTAVKKTLAKLPHPPQFLDVTALTMLRNDGHVGSASHMTTDPQKVDCSHWCFPGVPDTWNELLYAALLMRGIAPFESSYSSEQ